MARERKDIAETRLTVYMNNILEIDIVQVIHALILRYYLFSYRHPSKFTPKADNPGNTCHESSEHTPPTPGNRSQSAWFPEPFLKVSIYH